MINTQHAEQKEKVGFKLNIKNHISEHKKWYSFQAVIFILAGISAMVLPSATALGFGLVIGVVLIVSGAAQAIASFSSKAHWWSLFSALLSLIVGSLMIFNPVAGTVAIATLLAVFLAIEGIAELFLSFQFRSVKNWGWLLFSGVISLFLAFLIFSGWPGASLVFLGVIIGINLLLYGVSLIALTKSV